MKWTFQMQYITDDLTHDPHLLWCTYMNCPAMNDMNTEQCTDVNVNARFSFSVDFGEETTFDCSIGRVNGTQRTMLYFVHGFPLFLCIELFFVVKRFLIVALSPRSRHSAGSSEHGERKRIDKKNRFYGRTHNQAWSEYVHSIKERGHRSAPRG